MRYVVVGGGIVGLAVAQLLVSRHEDAEVHVLEKEASIASHQTGHNSGVVHAGLYYEPASLKARLCHRGRVLLQAFCEANQVSYEACGKVVVATDDSQLSRLHGLHARAQRNGVPGVRLMDSRDLRAIEPHVRGVAAIHSPATAVVDFRAVATALADAVVANGGSVRTGRAVVAVHPAKRNPVVELDDGVRIEADRVVVCAGLHTDRLARLAGESANPQIVPFRGEYWQLRDDRRHLVQGLVYPVPNPGLPFLGIHLTRGVDGSVLIGPNAVLALRREGYKRSSFDSTDLRETLAWSGTHHLVRRHWRTGLAELARSASKRWFVRDARRFLPELCAGDVVRAPAGVRAQAVDRTGALVDDFRLTLAGNVLWIRNAPSPAATSSLAIAEEVLDQLDTSS